MLDQIQNPNDKLPHDSHRHKLPLHALPLIIAIVLPIGVAIGIFIIALSLRPLQVQKKISPEVPVNIDETPLVPQSEQPEPERSVGPREESPDFGIVVDPEADTDNDGLTNREEQLRATSHNRADTDEDGLSDGDEVLRYQTDPLNPDSDRDGYLDGAEILHGYNPNGPGKLRP